MNLRLTYLSNKTAKTVAVFLSGDKLSDWLGVLSQWDIPITALECYPVPARISDPTAVGLFVIFKEKILPRLSPMIHTYQGTGKHLYIPTEAQLSPQVLPGEWEQLLVHDRYFYHPRIGLVGFSLNDQLDFKQLLTIPKVVSRQWMHAQAGLSPRPSLTSIKLELPPVSDFLTALQSEIDTRPLDEIPGGSKDKESRIKKDLHALQRFLLKKLRESTQSGQKQNSSTERSDNSGGSQGRNNPLSTWFGKAGAWLNQKLDDLEKHREKEIQRLLRMLDEDPDLALRYSIPLDGPYKNRGAAPSSTRLGQRTPDFNLGRIGGGGKADFWHLDRHYFSLREKYQRAAKQRLEDGDYRKAAYIYAHLLGDFQAAASALKQGEYFREAAALYKDHLNQLPQAAACLEEGGLFFEAIEIYKQLAKNEKIGDLYTLVDQGAAAQPYYEKAIAEQLKVDNYLEASRICLNKLGEVSRTEKLLLEGWKTAKQGEECLLWYFEQQEKQKGEAILDQQINWVYEKHVPDHKKSDFLTILISLRQKHSHLKNTGQDIAYEIISQKAVNGQLELLPKLRNFIDQDPLLYKDTSRFLFQNQDHQPPTSTKARLIQLDPMVKWKAAYAYNRSLVILGIKSGELYIARANWKGKVTYFGTDHSVQDYDGFQFLESNSPAAELVVLAASPLNLGPIHMPVSYHFQKAIQLTFPAWLAEHTVRICRGRRHHLSALFVRGDGEVQVRHYDAIGNIKATYDCTFEDRPVLWEGEQQLKPMFFRDNYLYTHMASKVLRIDMEGKTEILSGSGLVRSLQLSPAGTAKRLVYQMDTHLTCLRPSFQRLNADRTILRNKINQPKQIAFMGSRNLLIVGESSGEVYDLKYHRIIWRFPSRSSVIAVTAAAGRREFALIHANGLISIQEVPLT